MSKKEDKVFACPMHPEVVGQGPGMCPKCHMALERVGRGRKGHKGHEHHSHHSHHAGHEGHGVDDEGHDHSSHEGHSTNIFKRKFWISLALTVPTVLLSPAIQGWLGYDISFAGSQYVSALLGMAIFIYGGTVFLRSSWGEVQARQPGMMTLISMALLVSLVYSLLVTLNLVDGMDFWWELATLVTIMLLGHWIEMASVEGAQDAVGELVKLIPDEAELIDGKDNRVVAVDSLKVGDVVLVKPGMSVPIDGVVVDGSSKVDESMLTGESKSVDKAIGSQVIGGTINGEGLIRVKVASVGSETALAGIVRMVEEAKNSKSRVQLLADKAAFYLFYVSIATAALTVLGWWLVGESAGFILERVVTVLIIACPHALGLAIPLVTAISTTHAARSGLLIRQRPALETARNVDVILFDKTGTLTEGRQGVVKVVSSKQAEMLKLAVGVESGSEHSIAKAIARYGREQGVESVEVKDFSNLPGVGVYGKVDGSAVHVGGPAMIKELDVKLSSKIQRESEGLEASGHTVIYVARGGVAMGLLALTDVIRSESYEAVRALQSQGKRVAIVSGDNAGVVAHVARELGIDEYFSGVLPQDKSRIVKELQVDGGKVAMVGDGVNDAPALVQSDVGIAIGAGTDVAIESAGVILASSDPRGVSKVVKLSQATYSKMVQNLIWATGYNALALPLAAGVLMSAGVSLSPAVGAILMSLSTIVVAINAQLLRRLRL